MADDQAPQIDLSGSSAGPGLVPPTGNTKPQLANQQRNLPNVAQLIAGMIKPPMTAKPGEMARPTSRLDIFENFLGNFLGAMGQGLSVSGHGPGANARAFGGAINAPMVRAQQQQQLEAGQAQIEAEQAKTGLTEAQVGMMKNSVPITTPTGQTVYVPQSSLGKILPSIFGAEARTGAAEITGQSRENVAKINQGGVQIPVDETTANLAGMPQLAGKQLGKGGWDTVNKALGAKGYKVTDLGNEGMWLVDRAGNKLKQVAAQGPSVARATAYATARAATTPFETVDANNVPTTISNLQAIRQGAPGITKPSLTTVMGKQALIDDIKGGIQQVKESSAVLDSRESRLKIAAALASPGITSQTLLQSPIMQQMTPQEQDYTIRLQSLREQGMAMRSVLGAGQGSEDLRKAILATIPNAATPGSQYANKQLDQFATTLERLAKGVPKLQRGGAAPATGTMRFQANGKVYNIPADQRGEFKKDFPSAIEMK